MSFEPPRRPLYIDLDGSLTNADVSLEGFVRFARRGIAPFLLLLLWLARGRAVAKTMVARRLPVDPATLPYRQEVIDLIATARSEGRRVVLASASHHRNVHRVARHLGLFDAVIATRGADNLKGSAKLRRIHQDCRGGAFDYLGDSAVDATIWATAHSGFSVRHVPRGSKVMRIVRGQRPIWRSIARAMRPHQWAKNALVAAPLVTAGKIAEIALWPTLAVAAIAFSLAASGVYLLNDVLDIDADRTHRTKCTRPIAAGEVSIPIALVLSALLLALPLLASALIVGPGFAAALGAYLALTCAYSFRLKAVMALDAIVLACLYTMRIVAGAVAIQVPLSFWLAAFSTFLFLSLAYLKRYVELAGRPMSDRLLSGRGYRPDDLESVHIAGLSAGLISILVLALFVNQATMDPAYRVPELMWGLCLILLYWINRIWMMARRGQVPGDPIAFAISDRRSILLGGAMVLLFLAAQRLPAGVGL